DNFTGANIYTWTRDLAPKMIQDRGRSIFLEGVGHSIPAEKPGLMTHQVVQFLVKEAGIKPTAANAFAQWRTTSVTFDQRGNGGIECNVAVRGRFEPIMNCLIYVAKDVGQIEYTFGVQRDPADPYMPPLPQRDVYMAPMALYEMKEFSGALLHEESSSQVPYIPNARKVVDEIIKLKQDDE